MSTIIASMEQSAAAVAEWGAMFYRLILDEAGERPMGYVTGSKWQRLDAYVNQVRPDPQAGWAMVAYYQQRFQGSLEAALIESTKEYTALERSLALEGGWDRTPEDYPRAVLAGAQRVRAEMFARRITPSVRAMEAVEREAAKPPVLVGPELPPDTGAPPFGALVSEGPPAGMLPPPGAGMQSMAMPEGMYV